MSEERKSNFITRGWRNVREAGPRRLALTGALVLGALLLARFSWAVPVVDFAERSMYDVRHLYHAGENLVEEQDRRIVIVVYNDQTLIGLQKRSPLDRGLLSEALRNIDQMGAEAIALDMLFDQPQDEDAELIETLRSMQTPVSVGYASKDTNENNIIFEQQQYLEAFLAQLEGSNAVPASVRLDDSFNTTRVWPSIEEELPPVLGRSMLIESGRADLAFPGYEGAIRYRQTADESVPLFPYFPIELFADPDIAPALAPELEGAYVFVGGDIVDIDRVNTSFTSITGESPAGITVHAQMLAQMLDGADYVKPMEVTLWALSLLVIIMAILTGLLEWGSWRIYLLFVIQFLVILGVPFIMQMQDVDTHGVPAVGWLLAWIVAFTAVTSAARASGAVQRNFAQGALGKYLPREMADEIIENPKLLALHGEKKEIYCLFSDLEGFTKMSHALSPEMVAKLLNRYLEVLSQVVLDHGGVIDKFVGDAVVAFWGAPISRPDDAERAAKAGYAMWQAGEDFRKEVAEMDPDLPKIGKTRVGMHFGEAVVGNFGGDTRIQYTALGDSMNTAARLEAANKPLQSSAMASREFAERADMDWWRPLGRVVLRGRAQPVDLMEPAPGFPAEDRLRMMQITEMIDAGDIHTATKALEELVAKHPADTALENLLSRTRNLNEEKAYVLG